MGLPTWAQPKPTRRMTGTWGMWPDVVERNVTLLRNAERIAGANSLDFVLYGDSITAFLNGYVLAKARGTDRPWRTHFGDLRAVALGIAGDQIGTVVWRVVNREKPTIAPKVIGLLIGVNDLIGWGSDKGVAPQPSTLDRLKFLIETMSKMYPSTHIMVFALTPVNGTILRQKRNAHNAAAKKLVAMLATTRRIDVSFADAAAVIAAPNGGPNASGIMADGVHLTEKGHDLHVRKMREFVTEKIVLR
jgi:lysophospholipase L1-like esterase